MGDSHELIVTAAAILVAAVAGQVIAGRTRAPSILLYLGLGVLLGPIGIELIAPHELGATLEAAIEVFVAIIVFEGAFSLEWAYLRQVSRVVRNLVSIGAAVTVAVGALAAHWIAGLAWETSVLFGALVLVTGPTAISPLLQRVRVTGRTRATLSGEGVIVDPIGAVVTLVIFEAVLATDPSLGGSLRWVAERIGLGALMGIATGLLLFFWLQKVVPREGQLARISLLAGPVAIFALADSVLSGSGLSAVVAAGVTLGNAHFPHREDAHQLKSDITTIIIASVYLLLAATLEPEDLTQLGWRGPLVVLVLMVIARPLGVFLSTLGSPLTRGERAFVAGIGPRGVVAASLATFVSLGLREAGNEDASELLGLVFLTIAITIAVQASYAGWLATKLGVRPMGVLIVGGGRVGRMLAERLADAGEEVTIVERDAEQAELARRGGAYVVVGDGTKAEVLERAGIATARTVVATTRSDKDNLLACGLARTHYGKEHVVSRVNDGESLPSFEAAGIRVMNPAAATATILSNLVRRPGIFNLLTEGAADGEADVVEVVVASDAVVGRPLAEVTLPGDSLVLLVRRDGKRLIPHGSTVLQPGDVLTVVGTDGAARAARELLAGKAGIG